MFISLVSLSCLPRIFMSSWHSLSSGYLPSWLPLLFCLVKSSVSWLFALSLLLIVNDPCPSSSSINKFVDTHPLSSSLSSLFVHSQAWLLVLRSAVVLAALQMVPWPGKIQVSSWIDHSSINILFLLLIAPNQQRISIALLYSIKLHQFFFNPTPSCPLQIILFSLILTQFDHPLNQH